MEVQQVKAKATKGYKLLRKSMNNHFAIKDLHIQNNFKIVHDFSEPFDGDYTKIDEIRFENCTFDKFPRARIMLDFIPHLSIVCVINCELTTKISREDLRGLEALKELWLDGNRIEKLPKGLFECTPNLESVSFLNNDIKEIDAAILDPLWDLKYFDLSGNVDIDVWFDAKDNRGDVTLEELKEEIKKCDPIEKLRDELKNEIQAVKQENAQLKQQVEDSNKKFAEIEEKLNNLGKICDDQKAEIEELKKLRPIVSDFTVIVNGKEFRVNKALLKANSPMLAKLIVENDKAETLEVADISTGTFEEVLKFMRTKIQPDENANLIELYAASAKLEMEELMNITAEMIMEKITLANAPDILKFSIKYDDERLRKKALDAIIKKYPTE